MRLNISIGEAQFLFIVPGCYKPSQVLSEIQQTTGIAATVLKNEKGFILLDKYTIEDACSDGDILFALFEPTLTIPTSLNGCAGSPGCIAQETAKKINLPVLNSICIAPEINSIAKTPAESFNKDVESSILNHTIPASSKKSKTKTAGKSTQLISKIPSSTPDSVTPPTDKSIPLRITVPDEIAQIKSPRTQQPPQTIPQKVTIPKRKNLSNMSEPSKAINGAIHESSRHTPTFKVPNPISKEEPSSKRRNRRKNSDNLSIIMSSTDIDMDDSDMSMLSIPNSPILAPNLEHVPNSARQIERKTESKHLSIPLKKSFQIESSSTSADPSKSHDLKVLHISETQEAKEGDLTNCIIHKNLILEAQPLINSKNDDKKMENLRGDNKDMDMTGMNSNDETDEDVKMCGVNLYCETNDNVDMTESKSASTALEASRDHSSQFKNEVKGLNDSKSVSESSESTQTQKMDLKVQIEIPTMVPTRKVGNPIISSHIKPKPIFSDNSSDDEQLVIKIPAPAQKLMDMNEKSVNTNEETRVLSPELTLSPQEDSVDGFTSAVSEPSSPVIVSKKPSKKLTTLIFSKKLVQESLKKKQVSAASLEDKSIFLVSPRRKPAGGSEIDSGIHARESLVITKEKTGPTIRDGIETDTAAEILTQLSVTPLPKIITAKHAVSTAPKVVKPTPVKTLRSSTIAPSSVSKALPKKHVKLKRKSLSEIAKAQAEPENSPSSDSEHSIAPAHHSDSSSASSVSDTSSTDIEEEKDECSITQVLKKKQKQKRRKSCFEDLADAISSEPTRKSARLRH